MASEVLPVPEEQLLHFCAVLDAGLEARGTKVPAPLRAQLEAWVEEYREYATEELEMVGDPRFDPDLAVGD